MRCWCWRDKRQCGPKRRGEPIRMGRKNKSRKNVKPILNILYKQIISRLWSKSCMYKVYKSPSVNNIWWCMFRPRCLMRKREHLVNKPQTTMILPLFSPLYCLTSIHVGMWTCSYQEDRLYQAACQTKSVNTNKWVAKTSKTSLLFISKLKNGVCFYLWKCDWSPVSRNPLEGKERIFSVLPSSLPMSLPTTPTSFLYLLLVDAPIWQGAEMGSPSNVPLVMTIMGLLFAYLTCF